MDTTITVSEKAAQIIREKAAQNGKEIVEFVESLVEENFAGTQTNGNKKTVSSAAEPERRYVRMKGMFSGGDGKSAERVKEIMLAEIDPVEGLCKK